MNNEKLGTLAGVDQSDHCIRVSKDTTSEVLLDVLKHGKLYVKAEQCIERADNIRYNDKSFTKNVPDSQ